MHRTSCKSTELRRLDTNRKNTDADRPVPPLECERIAAQHSAFLSQVAREICSVDFGLKTHKVAMTHGRNEMFMIWKCRQKLWGWKRDMVKKPDFVAVPAIPKCLGQRQQVIIMNPDNVVGLQNLVQLRGEALVNPHIAAEITAREFRKI